MKSSVLIFSILTSALLAAGCGNTAMKESKQTIREQAVVSHETPKEIVGVPAVCAADRPEFCRETTKEILGVPTVGVTAPALRTCTYTATAYSNGSFSCQTGYQYRCSDGVWVNGNLAC